MWAQEVIVGNPEGKIIVGAVDVVKPICMPVRSFIGAVEPFNHLLEWTELFGDGIVVGKPDHLCDLESKIFSELLCEFHCSKGIGAVAVGDEHKLFRQLCKSPKGHAHGEDAGTDAAVVRDPVTDNGTGNGIHDEPDVGFDTADFDISFVSGEDLALFVGVLVNKGFDADSGGFAVVGDLLVRDADVIEIFQSLGGFAQGEAKVDVKRQAKGHDVGVILAEFQR